MGSSLISAVALGLWWKKKSQSLLRKINTHARRADRKDPKWISQEQSLLWLRDKLIFDVRIRISPDAYHGGGRLHADDINCNSWLQRRLCPAPLHHPTKSTLTWLFDFGELVGSWKEGKKNFFFFSYIIILKSYQSVLFSWKQWTLTNNVAQTDGKEHGFSTDD